VSSNQWSTVHEQQWTKNSIVALIEWLPNLTKTTMPTMLRKQLLQQNSNPDFYQPIDKNSEDFTSLDETQLEHLVQWSDLVIFDYLTGNYDRMASMQVKI
jgi:four-jointed box protein 1